MSSILSPERLKWGGGASGGAPTRKERARRGVVAAFDELFPKAFRVAVRILRDRAAAEDVAAEALGRAYARWGRLQSLSYRDAWVMRVATNLALNQVARRPPPLAAASPVHLDDAVVDSVVLGELLRRLPRRQREAVVLRHLVGLSESDTAAVLGISEGTVKTHCRRGLEAMRAVLRRENESGDHAG